MKTYHSDNERLVTKAFQDVLRFAGASLVRDEVDQRIIYEVRSGKTTYKKGIIDSQNDVGGWPELKSETPPQDSSKDGMPDDWKIEMKLNPEANNPNGNELSTAYDNIEVYINSLVALITEQQNK